MQTCNTCVDNSFFVGEHIDYCGYSVLPMAIEQDVVIATAVTETQEVLLSNIKSDTYR
jgi:N-acetylgalactosamine kinase